MTVAHHRKTRNGWQSPAVAHPAQRTHAGDVTPLQRSNGRVGCLRNVICNEGFPFRPYRGAASAQRVFVPGDLDHWLLTLTFNLIRAKYRARVPREFDVNPFSGSCHPLSNASPKNRTRILGAKSAEIGDTPSFLEIAFHNWRRIGKRMGALTAQKSYVHRVKIWWTLVH